MAQKKRKTRRELAKMPEAYREAVARKEVPRSMRKPYKDAFLSNSKASAIKALCLECQGFERAAVRDCDCRTCPLWRHRPYRFSAEVGV